MSIVYRVQHATRYRYDAPVSQCQSEVRLSPRALPWQTVLDATITTTPESAWSDTRTDYFGNEGSDAAFYVSARRGASGGQAQALGRAGLAG